MFAVWKLCRPAESMNPGRKSRKTQRDLPPVDGWSYRLTIHRELLYRNIRDWIFSFAPLKPGVNILLRPHARVHLCKGVCAFYCADTPHSNTRTNISPAFYSWRLFILCWGTFQQQPSGHCFNWCHQKLVSILQKLQWKHRPSHYPAPGWNTERFPHWPFCFRSLFQQKQDRNKSLGLLTNKRWHIGTRKKTSQIYSAERGLCVPIASVVFAYCCSLGFHSQTTYPQWFFLSGQLERITTTALLWQHTTGMNCTNAKAVVIGAVSCCWQGSQWYTVYEYKHQFLCLWRSTNNELAAKKVHWYAQLVQRANLR